MSVWTVDLPDDRRPLLIAHRGAPEQRTENTLESFYLARQQGADVLEVDVQLTADGVPVAFHDHDLSVRYGRNETISAFSYTDLNAQFPDVPLLSRVLDIAEFFYIDVKCSETEELVQIFDFCRSRCDLSKLITAVDRQETSVELFRVFPDLNQVIAIESLDDSFSLSDSTPAKWIRLKEEWLCEDDVRAWAQSNASVMITAGGYGSLTVGHCTRDGLRNIESAKPDAIVVNDIEMARRTFGRAGPAQ